MTIGLNLCPGAARVLQTISGSSTPAIGLADAARNSEYVVFSLDALREMFNTIWHNVGSIVSVALFVFLLVAAVYAIFEIVSYFGR